MPRGSHPTFRGPAAFAAVAVLAPLLGCQPDGAPPAMSLDEARGVTARFADKSFVPPPRTITDITAILDQQKQAKRRKVAARETLADSQPPETADKRALSDFYDRRGRAAQKLGRIRQSIADYGRAEALRRAMLALIDGPGHVDAASGKTVFSYAHPIFWAPFSLIGDDG